MTKVERHTALQRINLSDLSRCHTVTHRFNANVVKGVTNLSHRSLQQCRCDSSCHDQIEATSDSSRDA